MNEPRAASERYWLNRALFDLGDLAKRKEFAAAPETYVDGYPLDPPQRQAMLEGDLPGLLRLGALPNLVYKYYMARGLPPERFAATMNGEGHG